MAPELKKINYDDRLSSVNLNNFGLGELDAIFKIVKGLSTGMFLWSSKTNKKTIFVMLLDVTNFQQKGNRSKIVE